MLPNMTVSNHPAMQEIATSVEMMNTGCEEITGILMICLATESKTISFIIVAYYIACPVEKGKQHC
jgi:hypothetical protein